MSPDAGRLSLSSDATREDEHDAHERQQEDSEEQSDEEEGGVGGFE